MERMLSPRPLQAIVMRATSRIPMSSEIICYVIQDFAAPLRNRVQNHCSCSIRIDAHILDKPIIAALPIRQIFIRTPYRPVSPGICRHCIHPAHEQMSSSVTYETHLFSRNSAWDHHAGTS